MIRSSCLGTLHTRSERRTPTPSDRRDGDTKPHYTPVVQPTTCTSTADISAIVRAPLPLDTARKDISNTNEGKRARLFLRLCPCQPVKPLLSNSVVQRAGAKDHHYCVSPTQSHNYTNTSAPEHR